MSAEYCSVGEREPDWRERERGKASWTTQKSPTNLTQASKARRTDRLNGNVLLTSPSSSFLTLSSRLLIALPLYALLRPAHKCSFIDANSVDSLLAAPRRDADAAVAASQPHDLIISSLFRFTSVPLFESSSRSTLPVEVANSNAPRVSHQSRALTRTHCSFTR